MAPSTSPKAAPKMVSGRSNGKSASREVTPIAPAQKLIGKSDTELAAAFKSDLTNIRSLVTCSICDQLLYEPWTLGCGHTYCYSCLCSWFVPNQRKKTCPECRTKVKQIPAPNFLVKQMVDIFIKRIELMPADESIDQHAQKLSEEVAAVDKDRNSPTGLFKGVFPERTRELWYDQGDGVLRCPGCGHEHEGGPVCQVCGMDVEDDRDGEFSDMTDDDAELELDELDMDADLEAELEADMAAAADLHEPYFLGGFHGHFAIHHHHPHHPHHHHPVIDLSDNSGGSDGNTDDEEDSGSLQEFVVPDDEEPVLPPGRNRRNQAPLITISDDDDSDEGGVVSNRRPRRRIAVGSSSPAARSVVTVTDTSANGSEAGDMNSEAEMLRHAGWSPLDQGNDSDAESPVAYPQYGYGNAYGLTEDENDSDDSDTNTETMVGIGATDDDGDDDRSRENLSETPTYDADYQANFSPYGLNGNLSEDADDDGSEHMDGDGDTEMSVSPRAYRMDPHYYEASLPRSSREVSLTTDDEEYNHPNDTSREASIAQHGYNGMAQDLGVANEVHEAEDGSSDGSVRPPVRRVPRRSHQNARGQQYDPRISMIFAEHQQSLRGSQNNRSGRDLDGLDVEVRRIVESASRNRRSTAYRTMPPRRADPLRSSRSPSATRVISSSDRTARNPRQYNQRRHN